MEHHGSFFREHPGISRFRFFGLGFRVPEMGFSHQLQLVGDIYVALLMNRKHWETGNPDFPIKNGDFPIKNGDFPIKWLMFVDVQNRG